MIRLSPRISTQKERILLQLHTVQKDRPTHSHEYIFLLTKSEQYYYNNIAAREVNNTNLRSVWDINTHPFPDAHFATFPPKLVERCLLLSSKPNDIVCDPFLGSGTVGMVSIQHGRAFLGVELNPQYVEITRNRLARIDEQPLTTHNKH
jgi:site-specific DNA-methyltransferase (cytosine-N4-specific)